MARAPLTRAIPNHQTRRSAARRWSCHRGRRRRGRRRRTSMGQCSSRRYSRRERGEVDGFLKKATPCSRAPSSPQAARSRRPCSAAAPRPAPPMLLVHLRRCPLISDHGVVARLDSEVDSTEDVTRDRFHRRGAWPWGGAGGELVVGRARARASSLRGGDGGGRRGLAAPASSCAPLPLPRLDAEEPRRPPTSMCATARGLHARLLRLPWGRRTR